MSKAFLIAFILLATVGLIAYRYGQRASQSNRPAFSPRTAEGPTYTPEILTRNGSIAEDPDITTTDGYPLIDYHSQDVKEKQPAHAQQ